MRQSWDKLETVAVRGSRDAAVTARLCAVSLCLPLKFSYNDDNPLTPRGLRVSVRSGIAASIVAASLLSLHPSAAGAQSLSAADRAAYESALSHGRSGQWDAAERAAETAGDQRLAKVVRWLRLQDDRSGLGFRDHAAFLKANPEWPRAEAIARRAEEAMGGASDAEVLAWFAQRRPATADGRLRLAEAMYGSGRKTEAERMIRDAWIEADFGAKQELHFLKRYGHLLGAGDHAARLDRLLWAGRAQDAKSALRRVSAGQKALAEARISLRNQQRNADGALKRVPPDLQAHPGLQYERLRWRRLKGRDDDAFEILLKPPKDLVRPDLWWNERSIMARRALVLGRVTDGYRIAADHRLPASHGLYAEAEWLAGWIALRQLDDRKEALAHLDRVYHATESATGRARAAYWAGRAAGGLGEEAAAAAWFARAGEYGTTYYGQLALETSGRIDLAKRPNADPRVDDRAAADFERHEFVGIVRALAELGEERLVRAFVDRMARMNGEPVWLAQTGRLAAALGPQELGVRVSRAAAGKGVMLLETGYPVVGVPDGQPERSLTLAVIRQESAFSLQATSSAGAMGLMQLMPGTAREVARFLGLGYSKGQLTRDAEYNIRLGRGYLSAMIDRFAGSYVLALASYNAGPGAVQRWLRDHGDPRVHGDMVDWIEMIPYRETRDYVQRVLANLQIYRQRLGESQIATTLANDLRR
jgi:soluble lytic murein transglycosylase